MMLPLSYQFPAALALFLGGLVACFAGYRLFRFVLGIYGFIAGAMLASSTMGSSNTIGMLAAALIGGIIGSLLLYFAYFVGIALTGAGLGVAVAHVGWTRFSALDPPWTVVLPFAALGTIVALVLQRYVIIIGTAFSGAWIMIIGALAVVGDRAAARAASSNAWIMYPLTPIPGAPWAPMAWVVLGLLGMGAQLTVTSRRR